MPERRAPDPLRPGEVPKGKPFAGIGRPEAGVVVVALVVTVAVALIVYALVT
ncbi:MAG TPA: hypothetical protein VE615_02305 [Gaiellaceae bacterium]|jgi:hypothetical protein|nr:hypothetical protein [Gaiellaceae bacterium]